MEAHSFPRIKFKDFNVSKCLILYTMDGPLYQLRTVAWRSGAFRGMRNGRGNKISWREAIALPL
jgi:hypothetical protein